MAVEKHTHIADFAVPFEGGFGVGTGDYFICLATSMVALEKEKDMVVSAD